MSLQDQLHGLFLLEKRVRGLRTRLDSASRRLTQQQTRLGMLQQQQAEVDAQLKHGQASAADLEKRVAEMEAKVAQHREQMNTVTSNKEYSALLVEVNTLKVEKGKVEEEALGQMTRVDELKQQFDEFAAKIDEQQRLLKHAEGEVEEARSAVGDQLAEAEAERDAAASEVPLDARAQFTRLADLHDGEAMAGIEEQDRRRMEYTCGACFMSLPIEIVNSLMTRPDDVKTCPTCHRILYISKDLKSAIGSK